MLAQYELDKWCKFQEKGNERNAIGKKNKDDLHK